MVPPNLTLLKLPPYAPELNSVENVVYLPPYTPELQPAETLWVHVDEPIVNKHFDTLADLDAVLGRKMQGPRRRPRPHQRPGRLPLVAQPKHSDLITRNWY